MLQISTWDKNKFNYQLNDTIFSYLGIDAIIKSKNSFYKDQFEKKFKQVVTSELKEEISGSYNDPLTEISIYFNNENEITYIDPGYDRIYYEQLKDEIRFSNIFVEKLMKSK